MHEVEARGLLRFRVVGGAIHDQHTNLVAHVNDLVEAVVGFQLIGVNRRRQNAQAGLTEFGGHWNGSGFARPKLRQGLCFFLILIAIDQERHAEVAYRLRTAVAHQNRKTGALARVRNSGLRHDANDGGIARRARATADQIDDPLAMNRLKLWGERGVLLLPTKPLHVAKQVQFLVTRLAAFKQRAGLVHAREKIGRQMMNLQVLDQLARLFEIRRQARAQ